MARTDTLGHFLTDVASAIKNKKGDQTAIQASSFDTEITNLPSGGSSIDWTTIGYSEEPKSIEEDYNYALEIKNNWTSSSDPFGAFKNDRKLVYAPNIVISSNYTSADYMFQNCVNLKTISPLLDFSNIINANSIFYGCSTLIEIPSFNFSKATNIANCCISCYALKTIGLIDCSKVANISGAFTNCSKLENLSGFKDLGKGYSTSQSASFANYKLDLSASNSITHDSLMNVINNLYDIATAGVQIQQLVIGSTNLAKLTAQEIQIATDKGWVVS